MGGFFDNNNIGATWVFTRVGNGWSQQGGKLVGTGATGTSQQGFSVALSGDGNTALVGGYADSGLIGAAWIFRRSGSVWAQQGSKLVGTGASSVPAGVLQGRSVALSADGNTAIVGGPNDAQDTGAAWIYTRIGNFWVQQGSKLVGTGGVITPSFGGQGWSVALSADGNTALVGSANDDNAKGAAWVFTRNGSVWHQQGGKLVGTAAVDTPYGASQGSSVSLSSDGNTAAVGGFYDNNGSGAVWVFKRTNGVWGQMASKLTGAGTAGNSTLLGYSVSLSSDGNTVMMGGPGDASGLGATWVFTHETPLPIQLVSFTATIVNGGHVRLDWSTLGEINNYGYDAQRRLGSQGEFQTVPNSFIAGHGTTNEPHSYSYIDTTVPAGQWHYRLRQTDLDGTFHFGPEVAVVVTGVGETQIPRAFALYQNYPNPFNPSTEVKFSVAKTGRARIEVYNIIGQRVSVLFNDVAEAGRYHTVRFDGSNLASGVYFYRMQSGDFTAIKKLLLLK